MRCGADLRTTQRWMQTAIMGAGPVKDAGHILLPSRTLTAAQRLGIYRGMYEGRLAEALETDYPLLSGFLGERLFRELVRLYIREHPSRSYTLNRLGDHLPGFLAEVEGLPRPAFLQDLARYELALTEVFDEAETPPIEPDEIAARPEQEWENALLKPIAAFRLLSLRYPVREWARLFRQDATTPAPRRRNTWLAVFRRRYRPRALELTRPAFRILEALAAGAPLGVAIRRVRAGEEQLFGWFREWVSEGLFQSVTPARAAPPDSASPSGRFRRR